MTSYDTKTILTYGLFTNDVRATVTREQLYQWVVLAAMSFSEDSLSLEELQAKVSGILNLNRPVPAEHISSALERAVAENKVTKVDADGEQRFTVTDSRRKALQKAQGIYADNRRAMLEHISAKCKEFLGEELSPQVADLVINDVEYLLEEAFCKFSFDETQDFLDQAVTEFETPDALLDSVADRLWDKANSLEPPLRLSHIRSQLIQDAIKEAFWGLPKQALRYVISLHHRIIYSMILRLDPNLQAFDRKLLKKRILYLDTNVVLNYLCKTSPAHESTKEVLDLSKELGCALMVSPATLKELQYYLFKQSMDYFRLFLEGNEKVSLLVHTRTGAVVLTEFLKTNANLTLEGFKAFLERFEPLEDLLFRMGILVEGPSGAELQTDDRYPQVLSQFYEVHDAKSNSLGRKPHQATVEHDTQLLLTIHHVRASRPADAMGSSVWLLTADYTGILRAQRRLSRLLAIPAAKSLEDWGSFLIGFKSPDVTSMKLDDYVRFLLGSKLGLVLEDEGVDIDFLSILATNNLLSPQLSSGTPEDVENRVRDLQQNQEMRSLLVSINRTNDEAEKGRFQSEAGLLLQKIIEANDHRREGARQKGRDFVSAENEKEATSLREATLRAEIDELTSRVSTVESKYTAANQTVKRLQELVDAYERNWYQRLRKLIIRAFTR